MVDTVRQGDPQAEALAAAQGPRLGISGVVLSKAQLLEALRAYVPGITDFSPLPDGQHFYLLFGPQGGDHPGSELG